MGEFRIARLQQGLVVHGMQGFDYDRARKQLRIPDEFQVEAVEKFWRNFYKLRPEQESIPRAWQVFKSDPFHPSLGSHEIYELTARAKHTIYAAVIPD